MCIKIKTILYDTDAIDPVNESATLGTVSLELDWTEDEAHLSFDPKDGGRTYTIFLNIEDQSLLKMWCKSVLGVLENTKVNDADK